MDCYECGAPQVTKTGTYWNLEHHFGDGNMAGSGAAGWVFCSVSCVAAFAKRQKPAASGCSGGHARHWFTFYGNSGLRSPYCQRGCGTPNPRPLSDDDWQQVEWYRELAGRLDAETEAALAARRQEADA